ncbi:MAG: class I SAM-dependent methyltransferase [Phycisphaerales bacterium]
MSTERSLELARLPEPDLGDLRMPGACPVCDSPYVGYIRHTPTRRTKRRIPLFGCFDCRSLFNPSGYTEDDEQLKRDLEFLKGVVERNIKASNDMFDALAQRGVKPRRVLEIGGGTGTLLDVARSRGIDGIGYDVNPRAVAWGKETYGLDLRSEHWSADTDCGPFDLLVCISVFEHIPEPRGLFAEVARRCARENAHAFISVPYVHRNRWHFIEDPDPFRQGTPFFDQDVHVIHYSPEGMATLAKQHGAVSAEYVPTGLWSGHLMKFE